MESLLRARDIETRILNKSTFGGYVVAEVDEFLDQISEDLELYVKRIEELERRIVQFEAEQKEYDEMKDSIQETLFAAQRAAKQIVLEAQRTVAENEAEAENILNEAREENQRIIQEGEKILEQSQLEREQIIKDAELDVKEMKDSLVRIKEERMQFIESSERLVKEYVFTLSKWRENTEGY
ncbi:MAG: DivIVA domain-containing protein [Synergistaceae bacterium]|nr:DivIVA domain-containing protein [Synergistaceae bacterium]